MNKMSGNKFLAETLKESGCSHFFHVPVIVPEAVKEMTRGGIQSVVPHSEKAAAYMADGYARASGKLGYCGAQAIGATNLAAGLLDAAMARSPVLALTGGGTPDTRERHFYQEFDQRSIYSGLTKFSGRIEKAERLPDLLAQAKRVATTGSPGPVHLELDGYWGSVLMGELPQKPSPMFTYEACPGQRPLASVEDIDRAIQEIAKSSRPIIIAGSGIRTSAAAQALYDFSRKLQIPVATSLDAKASIPESESLGIGVVGRYARDTANMAVSEADLVLFIGTTTGSMVTRDWTVPKPGIPAIQIDIDPREVGRNYPLVAGLCGDPAMVMAQLAERAGAHPVREIWLDRITALRQQWLDSSRQLEVSDAEPLRPERLCRELSDALPRGSMLVVDTGHSAGWASRNIYLDKPEQGLLRAAGSLGWSFPAALGAKCAQPERPVICFNGDGAFYYHISEMETAVRYGINTITVINNNYSFNQEMYIWNDQKAFEKNWRFSQVDFTSVAESFGCQAFKVEKPEEFKAAFKSALAGNRPAIIEVITDHKVVVPAAWAP